MSKLGRLRQKVNYEVSTPRCGTCVHFNPPKVELQDSLPVRRLPMLCGLHGFTIKRHGLCDTWKGKDGSVLTK